MVYITAVHMEGGARHEHIASVKWRNPDTGETGEATREEMVKFIKSGSVAKVTDGRNTVTVGVYDTQPPHIQTYADGKWTDNLLSLPQF